MESDGGTHNEVSADSVGAVFQAGVMHVHQVLPAPRLPVDALPPRPLLVGREPELAGLAALLDSEAPAVVVSAAVTGLAGVGKTTLAVCAAHRAREAGWCSGGVLFLDLHGYDATAVSGDEAVASVLRALGVPHDSIPMEAAERETLYRSLLADRARSGQRLLIVADNAARGDQVRPLLPGTAEHRVLITSRHVLADLTGVRLFDLEVLAPTAAVALLDEHVRVARPDDDRITADADAAGEVARLCGYLPLALRVSAALLVADPRQPVAELLAALSDSQHRLEALDYEGDLAVRAAFDLSYQRLTAEQARLFGLLSLNPGTQTSTRAAAALAGLPVGETRRLLGELQRAHLVEEGTPRGWWRFHDLVALYARTKVANTGQAVTRLLDHYVEASRSANDWLEHGAGSGFGSRHEAMTWLDIERPSLVPAVALAVDTGHDQQACDLAHHLHEYLRLRRRFDSWETVHRQALDAAPTTRARGVALADLGEVLCDKRRFDEAADCLERALTLLRAAQDRRSESRVLDFLGTVHRDSRRYDKALELYEQALAIRQESADRRGEGRTLDNLGATYCDLRRFDEAVEHFQRALPIVREVADDVGEGAVLANLGQAYRELRRFDEAIVVYEQAMTAHRRADHRRNEGAGLGNLALVYWALGRYDEAIDRCRQALPIMREVFSRHGEGTVLTNLGEALRLTGRHDEALGYFRQSLPILREVGERHGESVTVNRIGLVCRDLGRFDEAAVHFRQALALMREVADQHAEGVILDRLGVVYRELRRFDEAVDCHERAAVLLEGQSDEPRKEEALRNLSAARRAAR